MEDSPEEVGQRLTACGGRAGEETGEGELFCLASLCFSEGSHGEESLVFFITSSLRAEGCRGPRPTARCHEAAGSP